MKNKSNFQRKFSCFPKPLWLWKKHAFLVSKETVELILVVAFIALIIFVLYNLLIGSWNKEEQTAKSYLETLKKEIEKADKGGVGEFEIWQNKEGIYWIHYFGDKTQIQNVINKEIIHTTKNKGKNKICVCYWQEYPKSNCNNCLSLKYPAETKDGKKENWYFEKNFKLKITKSKTEDKYIFTLVK